MEKILADNCDSSSGWGENGPMAKIVVAMEEEARDNVEQNFHSDQIKMESPIERIMFCALMARAGFNGFDVHYARDDGSLPRSLTPAGCEIGLRSQEVIGSYRVDFVLRWYPYSAQIVVECDGHEFHEKTKEQAARDKARDRYLQGCGFMVFRFSGSEIWRDPLACADQVFVAFIDAAQRLDHG